MTGEMGPARHLGPLWLAIPLAFGLRLILRSEVK